MKIAIEYFYFNASRKGVNDMIIVDVESTEQQEESYYRAIVTKETGLQHVRITSLKAV